MNSKFYTTRLNLFNCFVLFIFSILSSGVVKAQPVLSLSPVIETGLTLPVQLVNAGDSSNRIFIVQQGGTIRVYDSSFNYLSDFLTVAGISIASERGLLSMVFHPDYRNNGFFYVYYTNASGNPELARYHIGEDANTADPSSKVVLLTIPHPRYQNHNGGELHFGNDGFLYMSTGDGGGSGDVSNNAQNTGLFLGKILRLNVNTSATAPFYTIPAGNPYNNEIFDLGLRNPFRWSFDRLTHDMWIGDVGQDLYEELNFRAAGTTAGVNYGWRCYEGNNPYTATGCAPMANYVFPVLTYPRPGVSAAITGGIVYRGTKYPAMVGYNISADVYSGVFYATVADGSGGFTTTTQTITPTGIVDFGEAENGEGYAVSVTSGAVYHLTASGPLPISLVSFNGALNNKGVNLNWQTEKEENIRGYDVEYSKNGTSFVSLGSVSAKNTATMHAYTFLHSIVYDGTLYYRLKIISADGSFKYSPVVRMILSGRIKDLVTPSVIKDGLINIRLSSQEYHSMQLISAGGSVIMQKNLGGQTGQIQVPLGKLATGVYTIRLTGNSAAYVQKIFIQ